MKVGILGAGQLGRMLALAGYPLGIQFRFFDTDAAAPAGQLAELVVGDYADLDGLLEFAAGLDVISYEFENVPIQAVKALAKHVPVYPELKALEIAQDRLNEKVFFGSLGIATCEFIDVQQKDDLWWLGFPCVLKTRRMGYDGKGQFVIRNAVEAEAAWQHLGGQALILERFVPFEREVSIIAVRNRQGEIKTYPLTENYHYEGILYKSRALIGTPLQAQAEAVVSRVLHSLDYVGILSIEFFVLEERLIVNEMAPRVHNSGHWTIEGAETSQFENHIRAVTGLPLGEVVPRGYSAMLNLLAKKPQFEKLMAISNTHLHWYGKASKPKRKLGHITVRADSQDALQEYLLRLEMVLQE